MTDIPLSAGCDSQQLEPVTLLQRLREPFIPPQRDAVQFDERRFDRLVQLREQSGDFTRLCLHRAAIYENVHALRIA